MIFTVPWCVNCGKPKIRCQCKNPVINSEEGEVKQDKGPHRQMSVGDKVNTRKFLYGRGSR